MRLSIRWRLTLLNTLALAVLLGGFAALIYVLFGPRGLLPWAAVLLAVYWALMMFVPVGIVLYAIPMLAVPAWRATLMELTADVSSMFNKNR